MEALSLNQYHYNWADAKDNNDSDNDELFSSDGYVSFGNMQPKHKEAPSWARDEVLQRSTTYATAPRYYNQNQKKAKSPKRRSKINNKEYISLFPAIDVLIWYLPTYILRNRPHKCKHILLLTVCIIFVLYTIYHRLWHILIVYVDPTAPTHNLCRGVFYSIVYLNPYIGSALRFYFFNSKFDWNLWHRKKKTLTADSPTASSSMSYTLAANTAFKTRLRTVVRVYCAIMLAAFLIEYVFVFAVWCGVVMEQAGNDFALSKPASISITVIQLLVSAISITIPDLSMAIVARIYFTECYLYVESFVNDLKCMTLDDIIDGNVCQRYTEMNKQITDYTSVFELWIMNLLLQTLITSWYTVSQVIMHPKAICKSVWLIYIAMGAVLCVSKAVFVLYPVMRMTEMINTLQDKIINDKINDTLKHRLHFHDEAILANLMDLMTQKQLLFMDADKTDGMQMKSMNTQSIKSSSSSSVLHSKHGYEEEKEMSALFQNITAYSKQECALEILNRFKYLSLKHSCRYKLFGMSMERLRIRDFLIVVIATNMLPILQFDLLKGMTS
eukprot:511977_1